MGIARLTYLSRRHVHRSDIAWRRRPGTASRTQISIVAASACCLLVRTLPTANATAVGPISPKPGHCKVAQQQLAGGTTIAPPDPRFDWRTWLDEKPADWPCEPGAVFGGLMPATDIPSWVLDELHRR